MLGSVYLILNTFGENLQFTDPYRVSLFFKELATKPFEELWCLALDPQKRLLCAAMIFRGSRDTCHIHPREVFLFAISAYASSIIIAHNHPSGDCRPSQCDLKTTEQFSRAGELLQIPLLDHIILTAKGFRSLRHSHSHLFEEFI